jgi:hypothetical protein
MRADEPGRSLASIPQTVEPRAVVPEIFSLGLIAERKFQESLHRVWIFDIEVRIVGGEYDVVFEAEIGKVFGDDFVAFDRTPALTLKVFERFELHFRMLGATR